MINYSPGHNPEFGTNFVFRQKVEKPDNVPSNFWSLVATGYRGEELQIDTQIRTSKSQQVKSNQELLVFSQDEKFIEAADHDMLFGSNFFAVASKSNKQSFPVLADPETNFDQAKKNNQN